MKLIQSYTQLCQRHPYTTKCLTTALLNSMGDFLCQYFIEKHQKFQTYQFKRTRNLAIIGLLYGGPAMHLWYTKLLPNLVTKTFPQIIRPLRTLGKKGQIAFGVFLDTALFGTFLNAGFFICASQLNGNSISHGIALVKTKIVETIKKNMSYWPAITAINLSLIPIDLRVVFVNFAAIFWMMIVSNIAHKKENEEK